MRILPFFLLIVIIAPIPLKAATLHFYSHPRVEQSLFHVGIEFQGLFYEADTRFGGRAIDAQKMKSLGDAQIEIPDSLISTPDLKSQMGLAFDYNFVWGDNTTYCSELVGIALGIEPTPMSFVGTHYLKYYPDWVNRNDPGLSPDQIWVWGLKHGRILKNTIPGLPNTYNGDSNPRFMKPR